MVISSLSSTRSGAWIVASFAFALGNVRKSLSVLARSFSWYEAE